MTNYRLIYPWPEIVAAFEEYLCQMGKSSQTVKAYGYTLKAFARFYQNELQKPGPYVSRPKEADFKAFIDYLRSTRHLAASSINRHIAALVTYYAMAGKIAKK